MDDGCTVHPHCLECPLPQCIYDVPGAERSRIVIRFQADQLDRRVARAALRLGPSPTKLARVLGCSARTVSRSLARIRGRSQ